MAYEPVLTKHVGEPNAYTLDFYLQHAGGYEGLRKALTHEARTTSSSRSRRPACAAAAAPGSRPG